MERLHRLVTQFYSSGDQNARSQLEHEVNALRSKPDSLAIIFDQVISPALCPDPSSPPADIHPQLIFVCLGLVQDFIRQWARLPSHLHSAITQTLMGCFHGPALAASPTYISQKVIQLLADVALFTWPTICDPINVAVQSVQNSPSPPPNTTRLRLALNLILTTSQALSSAQLCKYLLTARGAEIQSQWPQYAIQLEPFLSQTLTTLTIAPPTASQSLRSPLSPTSFAAGANAYPSPISASPTSSSGPFTPHCLDRASARICLQTLQLLTHQLQKPTLGLLHSLGTTLHPAYGKSIPFAVLDTLHAQLILPRLDQATFSQVLGASLQVLTDIMSTHQLACPATPAGSDADDDAEGDDDAIDDGDDDDNPGSPVAQSGTGQFAGALARKALRDLGAPIAAQHLLRSTPAQIVQLANALLAALHFPGAPGREARRAVLEVLMAVGAMPNRAEYVPLVQQVVAVVAQGLDQIGYKDLEEEEMGVLVDVLSGYGHVEIDAHPELAGSRLGQMLALLEAAAEIDPMGTLEKVFPTLNMCVDFVDRSAKGSPSSPPTSLLSDQVVIAFAVSLRAVSHLAPKCDAVPELAGVPIMVVGKCAELMSSLSPHTVANIPGTARAMLECVLAVQAMLEAVRIHERSNTSGSASASPTPTSPSPSPVPPSTDSTHIVQQLATSLLAVLSSRGSILHSPLAIACARLLASICTTVRPVAMPMIAPHVVQCAQSIVSAVPDPAYPIVDPAIRAVVACCVYPVDGSNVRAGSDEVKVRAGQLRDALAAVGSAAGPAATLPILTSVVASVSTDAHTTKSIVSLALDELQWTNPLVLELSQLLASASTGSGGPSATAAERINHLTRFFSLYVSTFVRSPIAQGLAGALLNYPALVRGTYPTVTPGVHRLLENLVADGKCFEPHLARFGAVLATTSGQAQSPPPPASLLSVTSRVLIDHWRTFFVSNILSASDEIRHLDTLNVLVRMPLEAMQSADVELVRAAVGALAQVHDRWRLFHKQLWIAEHRSLAISVVVGALVRDELGLLVDEFVGLLKALVAFDSVADAVFQDSLRVVYEAFVGAMPVGTIVEVRARWEVQVREVVGGQVADKAAFEAGVKGLVQDFKCIVSGY